MLSSLVPTTAVMRPAQAPAMRWQTSAPTRESRGRSSAVLDKADPAAEQHQGQAVALRLVDQLGRYLAEAGPEPDEQPGDLRLRQLADEPPS